MISSDLHHIASEYKIFLDTCSLMADGADKCLSDFLSYMILHNNKYIIPLKVVDEVKKHQDSADITTMKKARKAAAFLHTLNDAKAVDFRGDKSDSFADNLFQVVFTNFRLKHNLVLITQDRALAIDILRLNQSASVKTNRQIKVLYIASDYSLKERAMTRLTKKVQPQTNQIDKFSLPTISKPLPDCKPLKVTIIPEEGDFILTNKNKVKLEKEIGKGGEGIIYEFGINQICKIYKKEKLTNLRFEKLKLMVSRQLVCDGVCWPREIVFNERNEFIGYIMDKASGIPMQTAMFVKPVLEKNFPNWKRLNLVNLCINILDKIICLHDKNIIVGDINPLNILIRNDTEVYFVDTDSYQIESFPCPVGTVNFTAPEIQNKDFKAFFRTIEHEYFAVTTLVFMILLPGKPPFSQQGGSNPSINIRNMDFSYPLGEQSNKKVPQGPWRYIWSHLPYKMKEIFYNAFTTNLRPAPNILREALIEYKFYLEHPLKYDSFSNDIFPCKFKEVKAHRQTT